MGMALVNLYIILFNCVVNFPQGTFPKVSRKWQNRELNSGLFLWIFFTIIISIIPRMWRLFNFNQFLLCQNEVFLLSPSWQDEYFLSIGRFEPTIYVEFWVGLPILVLNSQHLILDLKSVLVYATPCFAFLTLYCRCPVFASIAGFISISILTHSWEPAHISYV